MGRVVEWFWFEFEPRREGEVDVAFSDGYLSSIHVRMPNVEIHVSEETVSYVVDSILDLAEKLVRERGGKVEVQETHYYELR